MECVTCGHAILDRDNYCRQCGASVRARRLPVPVSQPRQVLAPQSPLPPLVVGGLALMVAGKVARWALSETGRALITRAVESAIAPPKPVVAPKQEVLAPDPELPPGTHVITRFFYQRIEMHVPEPAAAEPPRKRSLFSR